MKSIEQAVEEASSMCSLIEMCTSCMLLVEMLTSKGWKLIRNV